jgi:hypothetical protein
MINIDIALENPYPSNDFRNIWLKHGNITKNKAWEVQIYKDPECIIGLGLRYSFRGRDHAGLRINIGFFTYRFDMHIYDIRHWNHETNSW